MSRFNFKSAIWASIAATIVMTIVMWLFGIRITKLLGMTAGLDGSMMYIVGGLIHLLVGIIYGLIYAWIFEPLLHKLPGFLAGAIYGLLPFLIALFFMAPFLNSIRSVFGAEKPRMAMEQSSNPCAPCQPYKKSKKKYKKTYRQRAFDEPCAPMKDKHSRKHGYMWLISLINHIIYGAILGWVYSPHEKKKTKTRR